MLDSTQLPEALAFNEIDKVWQEQELTVGNSRNPATRVPYQHVIMLKLVFVSPLPIRGLSCFNDGVQSFFFGYRCETCHEIVLVPKCEDKGALYDAMKHDHPDLNRVAV
jgi:hypothetical protein